MSNPPRDGTTRRRPLLIAMAGGATALTGLGVAARSGILSGDVTQGLESLELSAGAMDVARLEVELDERLTRDGARRWQTARLATSTHSMVGFTWRRGQPEPHLSISSRRNGTWQAWQPMPHAHDSPDWESKESTDVVGTEVAWIGRSDGIRVVVEGHLPAGLTMVLLYPNPLPGDRAQPDVAARAAVTNPEKGSTSVPAPELLLRSDWGADESLRDGPPSYDRTIQQVHVHHTANSNDYSRHEVPGLIRGIYAYHTKSLGWSDIGYNFLVDRFGRTWVGRAGGPAKPVRGAHTLGFNATSTGVSVIGNFEVVTPTSAVLDAIAGVAAWKLHMYDRDPLGHARVVSEGSDKYRVGVRVRLPVIDGHRDTNDTACPGQHLYDALPVIRRRTNRRIATATQPAATITKPFTTTGTTTVGETLRAHPGAWKPADAVPRYAWLRDGRAVAGAKGASYELTEADIGSVVSVRVEIAPDDLRPATQTLTFPDPVLARTELDIRATGRRGRLVVDVEASAAGLTTAPTGKVSVTVDGRTHLRQLVDGTARTVFNGLAPGSYQAQVEYGGGGGASATTGTATATVKPAV